MERLIDAWNMLENVELAGNTGRQIVGALLAFVAVLLVQWVAVGVFWRAGERIVRRTKSTADDAMLAIVTSVRTPFYVILALYASTRLLTLPPLIEQALNVAFLIAFAVQGIRIAERVIVFLVERVWLQAGQNPDEILGPLRMFLRLLLGALAILLVLSNLGVNVTSLIAGLGIGSVAIGFALQEVLSDVFNSLSLYFDRPFRPGDFIIARNVMGTVKRITFNSTRLVSLQGEEIVIPNKDISNEWVQNFRQMRTRRVAFTIGVTYDTPSVRLKEIPGIIEKLIRSIDTTRFDRVHFYKFGEYSLDFEIVYYVESDDFVTHRNIQQTLNLGILDEFEKRGIEIALPTRRVVMEQAEKKEPNTTKKGATVKPAKKKTSNTR